MAAEVASTAEEAVRQSTLAEVVSVAVASMLVAAASAPAQHSTTVAASAMAAITAASPIGRTSIITIAISTAPTTIRPTPPIIIPIAAVA